MFEIRYLVGKWMFGECTHLIRHTFCVKCRRFADFLRLHQVIRLPLLCTRDSAVPVARRKQLRRFLLLVTSIHLRRLEEDIYWGGGRDLPIQSSRFCVFLSRRHWFGAPGGGLCLGGPFLLWRRSRTLIGKLRKRGTEQLNLFWSYFSSVT